MAAAAGAAAPAVAPARVALVTTLLLPAGGGGVAASFVRWHVHVGFERLYLFFDDPGDGDPVGWAEVAPWAGAGGRVVRRRRTPAALARQRATCACWARFGGHAADEVQARQCLNAEDAARDARAAGLRWLVHVDVDEVFFAAGPDAMAAHFAGLAPARRRSPRVASPVASRREGAPAARRADGAP